MARQLKAFGGIFVVFRGFFSYQVSNYKIYIVHIPKLRGKFHKEKKKRAIL